LPGDGALVAFGARLKGFGCSGERIRDKIAASKAKGMWMGGNVPLGYGVKDRKLIVNGPEGSTVRLIFKRYAELGSVALLRAVSKRWEGAGGELSGGKRLRLQPDDSTGNRK
jgi:site-specific DNA recombinase